MTGGKIGEQATGSGATLLQPTPTTEGYSLPYKQGERLRGSLLHHLPGEFSRFHATAIYLCSGCPPRMAEGEFSRGYALCSEAAVIFCLADDALLCVGCDRGVHEANDLVRRHERKFMYPCNPKHGEQIEAMGSGWGTSDQG
jgi:hypothetical protein